jgi:hypothetical protein
MVWFHRICVMDDDENYSLASLYVFAIFIFVLV